MMTWEDHLAALQGAQAPVDPMARLAQQRAAARQTNLTVRPTGPKPSVLKVTPSNTYPKTPSPRDQALANAIGRNLQQFGSRNGGAISRNTADPRNFLTSA